MGFISKVTGGLLGGGGGDQRRAAERGAKAQVAASKEAIAEQRAAREEGREILDPFVQVGLEQVGGIGGTIGGIQAPPSLAGAALLTAQTPLPEDLTGLAERNRQFGILSTLGLGREVSDIQGGVQDPRGLAEGLSGRVLEQGIGADTFGRSQQLAGQVLDPSIGIDPNFASSPQFQALQAEATRETEQSAAARGRLGAGGTKEAIARQSLLLGNQFQQQDLQNRLQAQGQAFGQGATAIGAELSGLQGLLGAQGQGFGQGLSAAQLGIGTEQQGFQNTLAAQQQRFGQTQGALGFGLGAQSQGFGQLQSAGQTNLANQLGIDAQVFNQLSQAQQQNLANQLSVQGQQFGQQFNLLGLGQASAAGTANLGQASAGNISNLLTGIGNVQAAGLVGAANASGALQRGFLGAVGTIGGAAIGGPLGGAIGSQLFG